VHVCSGETILAFQPWLRDMLDGENIMSASGCNLAPVPRIVDVILHACACRLPLEPASIHTFVTQASNQVLFVPRLFLALLSCWELGKPFRGAHTEAAGVCSRWRRTFGDRNCNSN
jgi:hypothetical protein